MFFKEFADVTSDGRLFQVPNSCCGDRERLVASHREPFTASAEVDDERRLYLEYLWFDENKMLHVIPDFYLCILDVEWSTQHIGSYFTSLSYLQIIKI